MLTAINTFQRHGGDPQRAERTLSLLQRGLTQIRNTVSALLVEAKVEDRSFAPEDIDDLLILVEAEAHAQAVRVVVDGRIAEPVPLPATLLRQIVLNLLLNAVAAAGEGGTVRLDAHTSPQGVTLAVFNDGAHIEQQDMPYLFEPFATGRETGHGLGLWIVYQITRQLDGEIAVESEPDATTFTIEIPYGKSD
jgi:signal transduction histidine kinase